MTYTVLIPAAGVGSRFGAPMPKQYAQIAGRPVLQHTLDVFAAHPQIARIAVIISPEDEWFDDTIRLPTNAAVYRKGGATRAHTVANGLHTLLQQQHLSPDTIVLVHDAARCCLPIAALNRLLDALPHCPDGAILAVPVADTLKQQDDNHRIVHTVPREGLWQAQTPQAFRAGSLHLALQSADLQQVTDEASAMERAGYAPRLIEGDTRNIKLTRPDDAAWAAWLLTEGSAKYSGLK